MNKRRKLLAALGLCVLAAPLASFAQSQRKVWRVGFFYYGSRKSALDAGRYQAFIGGMRELGYAEGKNLQIEARFADGAQERIEPLAAELIKLKVDVILATGTPALQVLQRTTTSIPVVMAVGGDPVVEGFAASLARPGGNLTGLVNMSTDVTSKLFELVISTVPHMSRVAVLLNPINGAHPAMLTKIQAAAQKVLVLRVEAQSPEDIERAFATMARQRIQSLIILNDTFLLQQFQQIAAMALKHRVPSIGGISEYAESGGLMAYGADIADNFRRAASYVDKILKGAKPGDLPIEQPTRFYLVINRKTAKAIGIKIPQSILVRADKVIE